MVHNEIFIHTDRGQYVGGDVIFGTVFLNVVHPFHAKSLFLEIKGYEKVFWEYEHTEWYDDNGQQKSRTIIKHHKGENTFFKDAFTLINYPGGFPMGQWSYPFQYRLPDSLPGVFEKKKTHGLKLNCKIRYKIKATVDVSGGHDLKDKAHLVVHEKLDKMIQPKHHDKTIEVRTCCCIPRGPVRCEAWMDKNAYMSGETAQCHAKVENNSAVDITHFTSKLIREIHLSDGSGHNRTIRDIISQRKYDGTPQHTSKASDIPLPLIGKKNKPIKPSTSSRLVKCQYNMMIEMDIPWAPDLEIYSPVTIYAPQSSAWANWQAPQWIAQAQTQQVCAQVSVPKEILDVRVQGGYFQPPPEYVNANANITLSVKPTLPNDMNFGVTVNVKETTPLLG